MFQFLQAKHRDTYIHLAFKHWVSPSRVYSIAHGSHTKNQREKAVQQELLELGIIHRQSGHHHSDSAPEVSSAKSPESK